MNASATREPAPPLPTIVLDVPVAGGGEAADSKPVEAAPAVLFILLEVADVHVAVGVYFVAEAVLLIIGEPSFVDSPVLVDGYSYDRPAGTHLCRASSAR